jgi:hypothetical protein
LHSHYVGVIDSRKLKTYKRGVAFNDMVFIINFIRIKSVPSKVILEGTGT